MRISGFLVGGLLGAAAGAYLSRGNRILSAARMASFSQALNNALNSAAEAARSRIMAAGAQAPNAAAPGAPNASAAANASGAANAPGTGLAKVQAMVDKDPALRSEVDQILKENRDNRPEPPKH